MTTNNGWRSQTMKHMLFLRACIPNNWKLVSTKGRKNTETMKISWNRLTFIGPLDLHKSVGNRRRFTKNGAGMLFRAMISGQDSRISLFMNLSISAMSLVWVGGEETWGPFHMLALPGWVFVFVICSAHALVRSHRAQAYWSLAAVCNYLTTHPFVAFQCALKIVK